MARLAPAAPPLTPGQKNNRPVGSPETPLGGYSPVKEKPDPGAPTGWSLLGCASSRSLRYPGPSSIQPAGRNPSRRRWGSRRNLLGGGTDEGLPTQQANSGYLCPVPSQRPHGGEERMGKGL